MAGIPHIKSTPTSDMVFVSHTPRNTNNREMVTAYTVPIDWKPTFGEVTNSINNRFSSPSVLAMRDEFSARDRSMKYYRNSSTTAQNNS